MNKHISKVACDALRLALVTGLTVGILAAQSSPEITTTTPSKKDILETQVLAKFEVTGSRVKRLDMETPAPVAAFSSAEIEAKGYVNIGDFVQSLPFNSGSANSIYQTSSFLRGASTANLRGLGSQRFLTLVNGRRSVPYALTNSGGRSVFDFNSLPSAAIESIELLKDGASAIYGADAITGVLNIKLKKNFVGVSSSLYYGNTLKSQGGDTATKQASLVFGAESGKTKILTAFDIKAGNSNFLSDYGVTTTDYTYLGANKGLNNNSTSNFPANLTLTKAQAAAAGIAFPNVTASSWSYVIQGGTPTATPTISKFVAAPASASNPNAVDIGNENRYNFARTTAIYPAYNYISNFTSLEHALTENLKLFAEFTYSNNNTYYAFTPVVIGYSTEGLILPANNPFNPFGQALSSLSARALFGPVRKFDTESTSSNSLIGLRGTVLRRWDWETAVSYGANTVTSISRNAIRATTYQAALNGTLTGFTGIFLNPFGPSDSGLTNALYTSSTASNKSEGLTFDASVSGKLFDLPAGEVGLAAGVEARNEQLTTNPDTAAYIGSGGGLPLTGKRSVQSGYVEITAPIYRSKTWGSSEIQVAGRHESYSDFGSTTKPKVGIKVRLPDTPWLNTILRASYSESFQAPALGLLYASRTTGYSSSLLADPLRPQDVAVQIKNVTGGNPDLLPETAKGQYVGAVFESPKIKNLSFNIDFLNFRINQVIVTPSQTFLLSASGRAQFPNGIVRDNSLGNPGPILYTSSVPSNNPLAYQLYRGMDYGLKYSMRNALLGSFTFSGDATGLIKVGSDSGLGAGFFNNNGHYYNPRWKGQAGTSWSRNNFGASLTADWTGHWFNDGYTTAGWGENPFTVVGGSLRYSGFWNSTITVGASNLLNNQPPPNGRASSAGYDQNIYGAGALGRFLYIRIRKTF
ncbi:MAG: TonB-dependent receptor plug domain-containing protein [Verrucomicrobiota bacterium]